MNNVENKIKIEIDSNLENVAVVRAGISTFVSELDINIDELMDIKTAVSEAVTNSIEHGYENKKGVVIIECSYIKAEESVVKIMVQDNGRGIEDISVATQPTYTSKPELEHSGLGFTIIESFMDDVRIESKVGWGTTVTMKKVIVNKKS